MSHHTRTSKLSDADIRAIIEKTDQQARGGRAGAIARAGLGTLALVVAIFATTEAELVGLILLCGAFILGLGAYIRSIARSVSAGDRDDAPRRSREATPSKPLLGPTTGA